jgi:histidinol-phosphatase (PHP family)
MKTNYHTHTSFCDGKDSPEDMVLAALDKGMDILGFSAHGMYPFASYWHLPVQHYGAYTAEIQRLKEKYRSRITILLGFEADYLPPLTTPDKKRYAPFGAEYLIGSVHYAAGGAFCVDASAQEVADGIARYYGGDGKKFVCAYYKTVREMMASCDFDIVGHIDVIRKRNGELRFFDETEDWYAHEIELTAKQAAQSGLIVEINTGGIARKAINDVYPSLQFLTLLKKYNVPVMINSDAHNANDIDCAFDFAEERAKQAGYKFREQGSRSKVQGLCYNSRETP